MQMPNQVDDVGRLDDIARASRVGDDSFMCLTVDDMVKQDSSVASTAESTNSTPGSHPEPRDQLQATIKRKRPSRIDRGTFLGVMGGRNSV